MATPWPDPRYRMLTPELLASVSADEIASVVVQHVHLQTAGDPDNGRALERFPPGIRAIYTTFLVDAEVNNGGFNQYFFNPYGALAGHALAGYELFGAEEYASVMRAAIATYEAEREQLAPFHQAGTLEAFSESYKHTQLHDVDQRYYSLGDRIYSIWAESVRDRPELFRAP